MQVHLFDSTSEAYNASQCDDAIKDGDVLVVASEGVIGFLYKAWPIAIVAREGDLGAFHGWDGDMSKPDHPLKTHRDSMLKCIEIANADADITGNDHWAEAS